MYRVSQDRAAVASGAQTLLLGPVSQTLLVYALVPLLSLSELNILMSPQAGPTSLGSFGGRGKTLCSYPALMEPGVRRK